LFLDFSLHLARINGMNVSLNVNGRQRMLSTDPQRPLLEVLREEFQLTGTKYGCGEGQCGACTVLVDGRRLLSCVTTVSRVDGKSILTIEGLAKGDALHPVQEAFLAEGAIQCGYCTPGMVLSTVALLKEKPNPTDADIQSGLAGQLCRCCGYPKILNAVHHAAEQLRK
jgi:carbon-monoxide dehydrogenase small subunit